MSLRTALKWGVVASLVVPTTVLPARAQAPRSPTPSPTNGVVRAEPVAQGLEHPWGLALLPDGRMLVTERPGRLRLVDRDGRVSEPLGGVPQVAARGQGGLLDVALDPRFAENRVVYLSYSEPGASGTAGTAVARGRLGEGRLEDVRVIYQQQPKVQGPNHFGSRLVFARDGTLFVTQGDRFTHREGAQDLSVGFGKIVRINPDGSVPADNPFVGRADARPEIWSYGHRNVQSAALDPADRPALDRGARGARRRRAESAGGGQELRLARHHVRRRLLGREDRRGHGQARHGAAGVLLGSRDRALRHDVLHGRRLPRLEGQHLHRLAEAGAPGQADRGGRAASRERSAISATWGSASATCARGRTGSSISSPTAPTGASCASSRSAESSWTRDSSRGPPAPSRGPLDPTDQPPLRIVAQHGQREAHQEARHHHGHRRPVELTVEREADQLDGVGEGVPSRQRGRRPRRRTPAPSRAGRVRTTRRTSGRSRSSSSPRSSRAVGCGRTGGAPPPPA